MPTEVDRFLGSEPRQVGSYRILKLIGGGSIGRVYLAEHVQLGRRVAIKLLLPKYTSDPITLKRFFGEARAANEIDHDNVVTVTDYSANEGGDCYYVMEHLTGQTVFELLRREGPPSLPRFFRITRQICAAVQAAHEKGIIHRDLKPENIFLVKRGVDEDFVKLLDFGVAKLSHLGDERLHKTVTGAILGTPEYMAPEQTYGRDVDHRADVYALGVIMYELLAGARPFTGSSLLDTLDRQRRAKPPPLRRPKSAPGSIPARLERLVLSCLEKEPRNRPLSMLRISEELQAIERELRDRRRDSAPTRRWASWWALVAVGIAAGATGYALHTLEAKRTPPREAARPAVPADPLPVPLVESPDPPAITRIPAIPVSAPEPAAEPAPLDGGEPATTPAAIEEPQPTPSKRGRSRRRPRRPNR